MGSMGSGFPRQSAHGITPRELDPGVPLKWDVLFNYTQGLQFDTQNSFIYKKMRKEKGRVLFFLL